MQWPSKFSQLPPLPVVVYRSWMRNEKNDNQNFPMIIGAGAVQCICVQFSIVGWCDEETNLHASMGTSQLSFHNKNYITQSVFFCSKVKSRQLWSSMKNKTFEKLTKYLWTCFLYSNSIPFIHFNKFKKADLENQWKISFFQQRYYQYGIFRFLDTHPPA